MKKNWFSTVVNKNDPTVADVAIYDEIGYWGINSKDFRDSLAGLGDGIKTINLRINSPGGNVFDGIAIHNMLARHSAKVIVTVDGLAASIASFVAMAGDEIQMPENAMMLVHNPSGGSFGTADDMREVADALDKIRDSMVTSYERKTGQTRDKLTELLDAETWLTAAEAKELGFANTVLPPAKISAHFNVDRFASPPAALVAAAATVVEPTREAAAATEAAAAAAAQATSQPAPVVQPAATAAVPDATATERERAAQIVAACSMVGHGGKAAEFIASDKSLVVIQAELLALPRGATATAADREVNARAAATHQHEVRASWDRTIDRVNQRIGG